MEAKKHSQTAVQQKELRLQRLREDIEKERRAILCLEAQMACLHSLNHSREKLPGLLVSENIEGSDVKYQQQPVGRNDESCTEKQISDDFIDLLDTLGRQSINAVSSSMKELLEHNIESDDLFRSEDQKNYYRFMPMTSGIFFTDVSHPTMSDRTNLGCVKCDSIRDSAEHRLYELKGGVLPEIGSLQFCMSILASAVSNEASGSSISKLTASTGAFKIDCIHVTLERPITSSMRELKRCSDQNRSNSIDPSTLLCREELDDLTRLAGLTKNPPKIFRDIVTYAEFDAHRRKTFLELQKTYGPQKRFSLLSPNTVRISLFVADEEDQSQITRKVPSANGAFLGSLDVVWKWRFSLLGSCGSEDLIVESIDVAHSDRRTATYKILNDLKDRGLDILLSSLGNDCCKALKLLLKVTSS